MSNSVKTNNNNTNFDMSKILHSRVINDWTMFGTVFLVLYGMQSAFQVQSGAMGQIGQIFASNPNLVQITVPGEGIKNAATRIVFILLGFAIYDILIRKFLPNTNPNAMIREVSNDFLKIGTMLVTLKLTSDKFIDNHDSMANSKEWMTDIAYQLVGFASGSVIAQMTLDKSEMVMSKNYVWMRYSLKFAVYWVVYALIKERSFNAINATVLQNALFTAVGFALYFLVIKDLVRKNSRNGEREEMTNGDDEDDDELDYVNGDDEDDKKKQ